MSDDKKCFDFGGLKNSRISTYFKLSFLCLKLSYRLFVFLKYFLLLFVKDVNRAWWFANGTGQETISFNWVSLSLLHVCKVIKWQQYQGGDYIQDYLQFMWWKFSENKSINCNKTLTKNLEKVSEYLTLEELSSMSQRKITLLMLSKSRLFWV